MYNAKDNRYETMEYVKAGNSGLKLPRVSLGLWHNFGTNDNYDMMKQLLFTAFDSGITYFDLADNYGPLPGSAETNFGKILNSDLKAYRDQMIIATKAGYDMWEGPYGNWGSRKHLMAGIDQSLTRLNLDYVDIFYHHRPDPETPIEETLDALCDIVKQGKALYIGLSKYNAQDTEYAVNYLSRRGVKVVVNQFRYNLFDRHCETEGLLEMLKKTGIGSVCFSPLAQGLLTDRYLEGIPNDSRAHLNHFLKEDSITPELVDKLKQLNQLATQRGQSLAAMALAWVLKNDNITTVLIGASHPEQITDNLKVLSSPEFTSEQLSEIDRILGGK